MVSEQTWSCANCGEVLESQFTSCWKCGTSKQGNSPDKFETQIKPQPSEIPDNQPFKSYLHPKKIETWVGGSLCIAALGLAGFGIFGLWASKGGDPYGVFVIALFLLFGAYLLNQIGRGIIMGRRWAFYAGLIPLSFIQLTWWHHVNSAWQRHRYDLIHLASDAYWLFWVFSIFCWGFTFLLIKLIRKERTHTQS